MGRHGKHIGVLQAIWPPLLVTTAGIPLALQLIAPNSFYGVRTAATLGSSEIWYRANLYAGFAAVLAGSAASLVNLAVVRSSRIQERQKWWFTLAATLVAVGAVVAAGLLAS